MPLKRKRVKDLEEQKKDKGLSAKATTRHLVRVNKNKPNPSPWLNLKHDSPASPLNTIKKGSPDFRMPPEVEAFCGDLARIIIGLHQPKYRALDDGSVITKEIKGFRELVGLSLEELKKVADKAGRNGLIAGLVFTFFLSENDGHSRNFGIDADFKVARIDLEAALHLYCQEVYYGDEVAPKWKIVPENLNRFLLKLGSNAFGDRMISQKGFEWERDFNRKESKQDHPAYDRDKFKYLLKITLLNRSLFDVLAKDHLSTENMLIVDHLEARRQALEDTLPKMENFQFALAANQETYWSELEAEFKEYNQEQERHIQKFQNYLAALEQKDEAQLKLIHSSPKYTDKSPAELKDIFTQKLSEYRGRLINMDELKLSYDKMIEQSFKNRVAQFKSRIQDTKFNLSRFGGKEIEGQRVPSYVYKQWQTILAAEKGEISYQDAYVDVRDFAKEALNNPHWTRSQLVIDYYQGIAKENLSTLPNSESKAKSQLEKLEQEIQKTSWRVGFFKGESNGLPAHMERQLKLIQSAEKGAIKYGETLDEVRRIGRDAISEPSRNRDEATSDFYKKTAKLHSR
jgi:hypothetical protein